MAEAVMETFFWFRSEDRWTPEFTPWCRRSPDTEPVMLVASEQVEAWRDKLDDERWNESFVKSHDVLASLAAQAEREDEAGLTDELDPDLL